MIKTIIIEDDEHLKIELSTYLSKEHPEILIEGYAQTVSEGIKMIKNISPELLFLDIKLKDGYSFEILENIKTLDFEIIFITGYTDYYQKAMDHFAFNYVLKPIDYSKLSLIIKRYKKVRQKINSEHFYKLKEFLSQSSPKILIQSGDEHFSVEIESILYCKAYGNFTWIHLSDNTKILASNGLKYYYEIFEGKGFFRASRFYILNKSHIFSIRRKETIIMSDKFQIEVSSRNKSNVSQLLNTLKH